MDAEVTVRDYERDLIIEKLNALKQERIALQWEHKYKRLEIDIDHVRDLLALASDSSSYITLQHTLKKISSLLGPITTPPGDEG